MRTLISRARRVAQNEADILIEAESGTGKELLARLIHNASDRTSGPFVAVNCSAFPENLLESELFGHVRGAFTGALSAKPGKFEIANGGTLLLDEIGEMPLTLQPKLLRVLQEREVDRLGDTRPLRINVRVIATTNRSLESQVEAGAFRADLYYRLNVVPMSIPPLRERRSDILELAEHFVRKYEPCHALSQLAWQCPRIGKLHPSRPGTHEQFHFGARASGTCFAGGSRKACECDPSWSDDTPGNGASAP
jgi:transcriptional regulator with GAF, ATPase, and Fis domain